MLGLLRPRPSRPNTLSGVERVRLLDVLPPPEHLDLAITQVCPRLLDVVICRTSRGRTASTMMYCPGDDSARRGQCGALTQGDS